MDMHRIEIFILTSLIEHSSLGYNAIKPKGMEGSLFTYHLKRLVTTGLVRKSKTGQYELTGRGKLLADKLHLETLEIQLQPRIIVMIVLRDEVKGLLMFKRWTQPVINMYGFPHVNIELGTMMIQNTENQFYKDSGLKTRLKLRGHGYCTMMSGGEPESYIMFHLLEATSFKGELKTDNGLGDYMWVKDLKKLGKELLPSVPDLLELMTKQDNFFTELFYKLD